MVGRARARRTSAPNRGDIVWVEFSETYGHEQRGRRPAIVISPASYNELAGLALVCPVTSTERSVSFFVPIAGATIRGFAIADQPKSVAWRERGLRAIDRVPEAQICAVVGQLLALVNG